MSYLIDTSVVIDYLRNRTSAVDLIHEVRAGGLSISTVTLSELYVGVFRSRDVQQAEKAVAGFLTGVSLLQVDSQIARRFGIVKAELQSLGAPIGDMDVLIASTAIVHDLSLITSDRDFQRVVQLNVTVLDRTS